MSKKSQILILMSEIMLFFRQKSLLHAKINIHIFFASTTWMKMIGVILTAGSENGCYLTEQKSRVF
jgi:hypothetical protein